MNKAQKFIEADTSNYGDERKNKEIAKILMKAANDIEGLVDTSTDQTFVNNARGVAKKLKSLALLGK